MSDRRHSWEDPEKVAAFAERDPDLRLRALCDSYPMPARVRVLDLGCAGGRNTELLARRGFDVWALDSSHAMVEHTRQRLGDLLGEDGARARVRRGRMDELDWALAGRFDLVVAIGVYHCASTWPEWRRAIDESARVLTSGGRLLVSAFTPETDLTGDGLTAVEGEPHTFEGFPGGRSVLLGASDLDAELQRRGLVALEATRIVRRQTDVGRRVTANGLYEKRDRRRDAGS